MCTSLRVCASVCVCQVDINLTSAAGARAAAGTKHKYYINPNAKPCQEPAK